MHGFKKFIENYGTNGGLEPPLQRPDIIAKDYDGPIPGNIKNSEKPPVKRQMKLSRLKKMLFQSI